MFWIKKNVKNARVCIFKNHLITPIVNTVAQNGSHSGTGGGAGNWITYSDHWAKYVNSFRKSED